MSFWQMLQLKNVGIGSTQPEFTLDVSGGIGATDVSVTGFTTLTKDLGWEHLVVSFM